MSVGEAWRGVSHFRDGLYSDESLNGHALWQRGEMVIFGEEARQYCCTAYFSSLARGSSTNASGFAGMYVRSWPQSCERKSAGSVLSERAGDSRGRIEVQGRRETTHLARDLVTSFEDESFESWKKKGEERGENTPITQYDGTGNLADLMARSVFKFSVSQKCENRPISIKELSTVLKIQQSLVVSRKSVQQKFKNPPKVAQFFTL
ncbi:hypothetical protein H4Q26_012535 [Puccinia striiformis f. sp. tritici PST-130]|nr:hypothetical protein H4Q26_012535 [Puccinia striiformis f. sp. tritici PST-130]